MYSGGPINDVISNTIEYVKSKMQNESSGHDWWHIERVRKIALHISSHEPKADRFIVEMAAILHDMEDWKLRGSNYMHGTVRNWLKAQNLDSASVSRICRIISEVSFKGAGVKTIPTTLEGKIVQDADRLDAMGAIGIARAFAYGGKVGREIYNPLVKPTMHQSFRAYKSGGTHTINHLYEKSLLLKERLNTETARKMAKRRHNFMKVFLKEFYTDWNCR